MFLTKPSAITDGFFTFKPYNAIIKHKRARPARTITQDYERELPHGEVYERETNIDEFKILQNRLIIVMKQTNRTDGHTEHLPVSDEDAGRHSIITLFS